MKYDYYSAVKDDVLNYLAEEYTIPGIIEEMYCPEKWQEKLYDILFCEDSVTGNASGAYFPCADTKGAVFDNTDLVLAACEEFGVEPETIADNFLHGDFDYFDVLIRCHILPRVIGNVVDRIGAYLAEHGEDNVVTMGALVAVVAA